MSGKGSSDDYFFGRRNGQQLETSEDRIERIEPDRVVEEGENGPLEPQGGTHDSRQDQGFGARAARTACSCLRLAREVLQFG